MKGEMKKAAPVVHPAGSKSSNKDESKTPRRGSGQKGVTKTRKVK